MRYSISYLVMMVIVFALNVKIDSRQLSEFEVRIAVQNWVRYVTADARDDAVIEEMEPYKVNGETMAYIAHLSGEGFCLCGADDIVLPVYLYSSSEKFDSNNPEYKYILWEIAYLTSHIRELVSGGSPEIQKHQFAFSQRVNYWQKLISGIPVIFHEDKNKILSEPFSMELPLSCQWSQGSPYNDDCPEIDPGNNSQVPVGCVATAMVQIMYYWQWPNTGVGSGSVTYNYRWRTNWDEEPLSLNPGTIPPNFNGRLEWTTANGGRLRMNGRWDISVFSSAWNLFNNNDYRTALNALYNRLFSANTICSANFGSTTYDWSILKDVHQDPVDPGDVEAAKLSYHAGIALDMAYGTWGSGASSANIPIALKDHFGYDPDGLYETITSVNKLTEEIKWLRPAEMRGVRAIGGAHGWVVYGYNKSTDPNRQFLMNMGWGPATSHKWYTLDSLGLQFTQYQYQATRLAPQNIVKFIGNTISGDGSPGSPYKNIDEALLTVQDNSTLIFKAGTDNIFTGNSLVITKPLTLKGMNVILHKQ